ncbi:hypothetical protein EDD85DRAFT_797794 [Armillaria nabsnona]|nr:hypothetical protein EDD85DRAFT_797794 [Armillaria nabsnona]
MPKFRIYYVIASKQATPTTQSTITTSSTTLARFDTHFALNKYKIKITMLLLQKIGAVWRVVESGTATRQGTDTPPQVYYAQDNNEWREIEDMTEYDITERHNPQDGQAACPRCLDSSWEPEKDRDEINTESRDSNMEESLMAEWNARTPRQVYRYQRGIARYWEPGTEPDVLSPVFKKAFGNKKT